MQALRPKNFVYHNIDGTPGHNRLVAYYDPTTKVPTVIHSATLIHDIDPVLINNVYTLVNDPELGKPIHHNDGILYWNKTLKSPIIEELAVTWSDFTRVGKTDTFVGKLIPDRKIDSGTLQAVAMSSYASVMGKQVRPNKCVGEYAFFYLGFYQANRVWVNNNGAPGYNPLDCIGYNIDSGQTLQIYTAQLLGVSGPSTDWCSQVLATPGSPNNISARVPDSCQIINNTAIGIWAVASGCTSDNPLGINFLSTNCVNGQLTRTYYVSGIPDSLDRAYGIAVAKQLVFRINGTNITSAPSNVYYDDAFGYIAEWNIGACSDPIFYTIVFVVVLIVILLFIIGALFWLLK